MRAKKNEEGEYERRWGRETVIKDIYFSNLLLKMIDQWNNTTIRLITCSHYINMIEGMLDISSTTEDWRGRDGFPHTGVWPQRREVEME